MSVRDPWAPPKATVADAAEEMDGRKPASIWVLQAFVVLVLVLLLVVSWDAFTKGLNGEVPGDVVIPVFMLGVGVAALTLIQRRSVIGGWLGVLFVAGSLVVSIFGLYDVEYHAGGIVRSVRNYALIALMLLFQVALLIALLSSRRVRHYYRSKPAP